MARVIRFGLTVVIVIVVAVGVFYGVFRLAVLLGSYEVNLPTPSSLITQDADRSRYIKMVSLPNFRSIGGYTGADGRLVHPGVGYRSAHWGDLSPSDAERITAMGVRTVIDLRSEPEQAAEPDNVPEGVRRVSIPIFEERQGMGPVLPALLFRRRALYDYMREGYLAIVRDYPEELGEVLRVFADAENLPVVIHCNAGKDRTGVAVALLLAAVGVPQSTILADYSLSNQAFSLLIADNADPRFPWVGLNPIDLGPLMLADPTWLANVFEFIDTQYGSLDRYLRIRVGLSDLELSRIRENLLIRGR